MNYDKKLQRRENLKKRKGVLIYIPENYFSTLEQLRAILPLDESIKIENPELIKRPKQLLSYITRQLWVFYINKKMPIIKKKALEESETKDDETDDSTSSDETVITEESSK